MKKYKLNNNTLGWLVFVIAAVTYLLTIEPTASFWDCPEFIAQGFKTEIGHPPGNPIFILAANFASKFAGGDVMAVAKCVNAMSAIFSALTILYILLMVTALIMELWNKEEKPVGNWGQLLISQVMVGLPLPTKGRLSQRSLRSSSRRLISSGVSMLGMVISICLKVS